MLVFHSYKAIVIPINYFQVSIIPVSIILIVHLKMKDARYFISTLHNTQGSEWHLKFLTDLG
jgi:hypothetical protein